MFYKNARIFCSDHRFHHGAFEVTPDGRFGQILPGTVQGSVFADANDNGVQDGTEAGFTGTVVLDDGRRIAVKDLFGFAEKVENKW